MSREFLPVTRAEMEERGIWQPDFVYISGDAYVDHPSFGAAIITRLLESRGYSVGIISQPDWRKKRAFPFWRAQAGLSGFCRKYGFYGEPLYRGEKARRQDSYSPGGQMGLRPDRAVTVYGNLIRQTYKDTPVILGGIELLFADWPITITGQTA